MCSLNAILNYKFLQLPTTYTGIFNKIWKCSFSPRPCMIQDLHSVMGIFCQHLHIHCSIKFHCFLYKTVTLSFHDTTPHVGPDPTH